MYGANKYKKYSLFLIYSIFISISGLPVSLKDPVPKV
jgi:hypothetical protein